MAFPLIYILVVSVNKYINKLAFIGTLTSCLSQGMMGMGLQSWLNRFKKNKQSI